MDRIERLQAKDIGPFRELEIEFPTKSGGSELAELHLLTGENGTGKSTLLYLVAAALQRERSQLIATRLRNRNADYEVWIGSRSFKSGFQDHPNSDDFLLQPSENEKFNLKGSRDWAAFSYSGARQLSAGRVDSIKEPNTPNFRDLSFSSSNFYSVLQWVANNKSKSALYAQNGDADRAEQLLDSVERIENAVRDITGRSIEFVLEIDPINVKFRVDEDIVDFEVLPEGLKSILGWLGDLLMRLDRIPWGTYESSLERPFYLFLDEIDVHLHPAWQRKVLPAVQSLFPRAQMFVTTHSPFVVASIREGTVHRLALNRDGTARFDRSFDARPGQSIDLVLEEVLGVPQRFDVETERKLDDLRRLREKVLSSDGADSMHEWRCLIEELAGLGEETSAIASAEQRQVMRILDKKNGARNGQGIPA